MAIRLVQAPDAADSPFVIVYHSGAKDEALRRAAPGALICVDTGKGFSNYYGEIAPGKIDPLPEAISKGAQLANIDAYSPRQVILAGWSEGCQGIRTQLANGAMPDAVVAIDGTHSSKPPSPKHIDPWRDFIARAKAGSGAFLSSCSSIDPGSYNSTRDTLRILTGFDLDRRGPVNDPAVYQEGNCIVFSCEGTAAQDHIDQGQVILPRMLEMAVAGNYAGGGPGFAMASFGPVGDLGPYASAAAFLLSAMLGFGVTYYVMSE
jgi:hypothetical protein